MPSTLSIITDIFPRDERGKAIGIWTGMAAIGIAAKIGGPQSKALITAARNAFVDSMGVAFLFAALVAFASAMAVYKFMPPRHLGSQEHAGGQ